MKRIIMILAAMMAVLSSCSKNGITPGSANDVKDIVFNISVSNPGADTKAVIKTGWAENDEISIWFDTNTGNTPDLVIKYDGSKWTQTGTATNVPTTGNGYAKALYNGTVKVASKDNYTIEGNTLTFNIENWKFLTELQVVVTGLTSASAGSYTLACDKFTPLSGNGYTVGSDGITASAGTKGAAVTGISNTDGVAFVFATAEYSATTAAYKFTLTDNTATPAVIKEYTATTDKISGTVGSMSAIKALTIESSSFTAPGPEYVEMKMGSSGNNTLKWAKYNLGASTVAGSYTTCYGDLYQWGSVETLYTGFPWTSNTTGDFTDKWKSGKGSGFVKGNNPHYSSGAVAYNKYTDTDSKTVLETVDDAVAVAYPGTNWRMPTAQEFQDLYDACGGSYDTDTYKSSTTCGEATTFSKGIYWCGNYDGVAGCLFCDGTNKLFFPAAGDGRDTSLLNAGSGGFYWSSTLNTDNTDNAYRLNFRNDRVTPQGNLNRYYGFSVRPVSD